jgi:hypothetical protein
MNANTRERLLSNLTPAEDLVENHCGIKVGSLHAKVPLDDDPKLEEVGGKELSSDVVLNGPAFKEKPV